MRNGKPEKFKNMTVRINDATDIKFGIIWNELQNLQPPQVRLSRNDVFETMVREYHMILTRENRFIRITDSIKEIE